MIRLLKPVAFEDKASPPGGSAGHRAANILSNGSNRTFAPKGAVLFVAEKLKSWISIQPLGGLPFWSDFLLHSRGY
jgi:hypothetical protein